MPTGDILVDCRRGFKPPTRSEMRGGIGWHVGWSPPQLAFLVRQPRPLRRVLEDVHGQMAMANNNKSHCDNDRRLMSLLWSLLCVCGCCVAQRVQATCTPGVPLVAVFWCKAGLHRSIGCARMLLELATIHGVGQQWPEPIHLSLRPRSEALWTVLDIDR